MTPDLSTADRPARPWERFDAVVARCDLSVILSWTSMTPPPSIRRRRGARP